MTVEGKVKTSPIHEAPLIGKHARVQHVIVVFPASKLFAQGRNRNRGLCDLPSTPWLPSSPSWSLLPSHRTFNSSKTSSEISR